MADLIDSYSESNYSADGNLGANFVIQMGQSFTNSNADHNISSCKFYLKKAGSPTGNAYAKLYAHTGTFGTSSTPTGSPLATSNALDVSTLTTSYALIEFTFSSTYKMIANTYYTIVIEYTGGNSSNYVRPANDGSSPTHAGNRFYGSEGGYTVSNTWDLIFYVYGDVAVTFIPQIIFS